MSHRCPAVGCAVTCPSSMLMCRAHWRMVSGPLQQAVYRAYRRGLGIGTEELMQAQDAAIAAVNSKISEQEDS